jgi:FAD/FMN-containing dehydrogenase
MMNVRRGDPGYDAACAAVLWNGLKPDRFPEVIVRAASAGDVAAAVNRARTEGLRIAVRSGGHSWCGSPLRDGGMLIDLSELRGTAIDPAARTATVQPAVTGRDLVGRLAPYGLAFPTGHCGSVAVGGYLLSGGLGWNGTELGPASASVQQIEAVTADGETVTCDAEHNADLFWAARGAGPGFFAVVTGFRLGLHPAPAAILTTAYVFPLSQTRPVVRWATGAAAALPPSVELAYVLATAPEGKVITVAATAFSGSHEEALQALEPLADCPLAAISHQPPVPATFEELYEGSGTAWPADHRCVADTLWSNADYETLLARFADALADAPSAKSLVLAPVTPVSPERTRAEAMAFSVLGTSYAVPYAIWEDPADDAANTGWLRDTMHAAEPLGTGHYIAEADLTADASRAARSFAPADWERLAALKERYDPGNVFYSYLGP